MVTMAERLKGVEKDISWIKQTNVEQSLKIQAVYDKLENLAAGLNNMNNELPSRFACKETERKVDELTKKWYYVAGGIAILILLIQLAPKIIEVLL
jgi:hypothetical protein